MNTRQSGFTLVELLVVAVLTTILMGAAYQALFVQDRSFRRTGEMIRGQDAVRTGLGILEAELREVVTNPAATGGPDIVLATRDSVVVRVQRRMGFICDVHTNDKRLVTWSPGGTDLFERGEAVMVFADWLPNRFDDDEWVPARISQVNTSTAACPVRPDVQVAHQRIDLQALGGGALPADALDGVILGAPVRGLQDITYGLYPSNNGWALGRRRVDGRIERLVDGLGGRGTGAVFTYLDPWGNELAEPIDPVDVAAMLVTIQTLPTPGTGAPPVTLSSRIHFRNN